jgi:thiaminase (transcriptional activator TenA)
VASVTELPLHKILWNQNRVLAAACLDHPFVRGLADGRLDQEIFKRYVAQDAFFLRAFAKAYALGVARSADFETMHVFRELLDGAARELTLHAQYSKTLGILVEHVSPFSATRAYTDFLLAAAWHSPLDELAAAMTPCMRLYAYLGTELATETAAARKAHPYRDWIETYAGSEFQALADRLELLLDTLATDRPVVRDAYRYAMECELRFFNAAFEGKG